MHAPVFETLIYNKHKMFVEIRFNRPHRLNAVVEQLYDELIVALRHAEADPDARAVLLTGEGRAFCVGADMKEHGSGARRKSQQRDYLQLANDACKSIFRLKKPVVAAINGYALGAGAEMACACDFVLIAESAEIGFPEVSIGTSVGGGVSQFLPRLVGLAKARELIFMGVRMDGVEAVRIGLALRAVADDQLQRAAVHFTSELTSKAPISMGLAKKLLNQSSDNQLDAQLRDELDGLLLCTTTEDWQEGVDAFAQKRTPRFKGR